MGLRNIVLPTGSLLAGAGAYVAAIYATIIYRRLSPALKRRVISTDTVPESLSSSETVKDLVNPKGHLSMRDSIFVELQLPIAQQHISDEVLLAQFLKGFFGGWVLLPEWTLFFVFPLRVTRYSGINYHAIPKPIWYASELSNTALPPLHTMIFRNFQVGDIQIGQPSQHTLPGFATETSIDIIYGNDKGQFNGVHRFSILRSRREKSHDASEQQKICVHYASLSCNPTVNKPLPAWLFTLHKIYGYLLFREGASEVMRHFRDTLEK